MTDSSSEAASVRDAVMHVVCDERDRLGEAAYAAYVATGADTDGAKNWQELFRPMTFPAWSVAVAGEVKRMEQAHEQDMRLFVERVRKLLSRGHVPDDVVTQFEFIAKEFE